MNLKKIRNVVMVAVFVLSTCMTTLSYGISDGYNIYGVVKDENVHTGVETFKVNINGKGPQPHFKPVSLSEFTDKEEDEDATVYCIGLGIPIKADLTKAEFDLSEKRFGEKVGWADFNSDENAYNFKNCWLPDKKDGADNSELRDVYGIWGPFKNDGATVDNPWVNGDAKIYVRYSQAGEVKNQEVAYILTNGKNKEEIAKAIWQTKLFDNQLELAQDEKGTLYDEAAAYNKFYSNIHDSEGKITYNVKRENENDPIKVAVNQNNNSYILGPFTISYPQGQYGDKKFSWISSITGTDQDNNLLEGLKILTEEGKAETDYVGGRIIYDEKKEEYVWDDTPRELNVPKNTTKFYIKFNSNTAKKVKFKVNFEYIESYEAKAYKYTGTQMARWWTKWRRVSEDRTDTSINKKKIFGHDQRYKHNNDDGSSVWLGTNYQEAWYQLNEIKASELEWENSQITDGTQPNMVHEKYYWEEIKDKYINVNEGELESLYEAQWNTFDGDGVFNLGDASLDLTDNGDHFDLTMGISGQVFIDKPTGKENAENHIRDDGEELNGVEVRLYKVNGVRDDKTDKPDGDAKDDELKRTLTDNKDKNGPKGYYEFTDLNSQDEYYVKFFYNGMLYTNVEPFETKKEDSTKTNAINDSKAKEVKASRDTINTTFAEIGSYPNNYKIKNKMFGKDLGDYNKTFLQQDIVDLFKEVSKKMAEKKENGKYPSEQEVCNEIIGKSTGDITELKRKLQFVIDCRVQANTVNTYPLKKHFVIDKEGKKINDTEYYPIYKDGGVADQKHVNLGIKARSTVDLRLFKDVTKAVVSINGKTHTYTYGARAQAKIPADPDYVEGLNNNYISDKDKDKYINKNQTRKMEEDAYNLNTRQEEVTNGTSFDNNGGTPYGLEGYGLEGDDRLNIEVTYKLSIVNESSTISAITEVVDYYDKNYEFVSAYVVDDTGKVNDIKGEEDSKYGKDTQFKSYDTYNTIYLRPAEKRLGNNGNQDIYVTLRLVGQNQAGDLLKDVLKTDTDELLTMNLAEINGYKTYNNNNKDDSSTPGLIDIDSTPGNIDLTPRDIDENIKKSDFEFTNGNIKKLTDNGVIKYEDDTSKAPAMIFKKYESRTISGTVFEDATTDSSSTINTKMSRQGNGKLDDNKDTKIKGVIVELVEIKDNQMITRATTKTDAGGNYSFAGFLPGNYTIRYTYGSDEDTSMADASQFTKGLNAKSYNGQDYQSTLYRYNQDDVISGIIDDTKESYWYKLDNDKGLKLSDARDDAARVEKVKQYAIEPNNGKAIINHKAEVFNAYVNPQPSHINEEYNNGLRNELEANTHRYAYTPEIEAEVEYARPSTDTTSNCSYDYNIQNVDFGITERPRSELVLDQDIARIKVTAADGTVLFDADGTTNNLQWIDPQEIKDKGNKVYYYGTKIDGENKFSKYDKNELVNIIMDEELINGAKLEITYRITVTNNSEADGNAKTGAKTIINYVSNNLNFDKENNSNWEVVTVGDIQTSGTDAYINDTVDLSTQSVILKTTTDNPLTKALEPGHSTTADLVLTKVLSTESSADDLTYTNLAEIVEIDNTVGRYDHGAVPGNQKLDANPAEHDAVGASKNDIQKEDPPDGTVIITPPTGSTYIYYVIGITSAVILAVGIYLIKKFAIDKNK